MNIAAATATTLDKAADKAPTKPMPVVASFSILGDMVAEIGGDYVELTNIIGLGGDAHAFEPTPEHARALANARVLVVNGLGFETWLPRLVEASNFQGLKIVASQGVEPRLLGDEAATHTHAGDIDPHAWQSLTNGMMYARNIAAGLAKADPANASTYSARADRYIEEMKKLDTQVRQALDQIAPERRKVVVPHDSLGYFGQEYGIEFIPLAGISSQAEASARNVAAIVDEIRSLGGAAVFLEGATNPRLVEQIARETDVSVGGTLYADTLGEPDQPAGTYLGMFKWNAGQLIYALTPAR
ncbi:metal ABC transporter solute-binding protein, Zn/Mn family [Pusillimonas sp.]|uniref:metal ABC transporter solute-binding protein, Zn/Mn family n=1 Tax=Pusillimonas sp. TaxID=3040095 RepID=UPI0037C58FB2